MATGFPDLSFEVLSTASTSNTSVVVQWVMHGTNTGPMPGATLVSRQRRCAANRARVRCQASAAAVSWKFSEPSRMKPCWAPS